MANKPRVKRNRSAMKRARQGEQRRLRNQHTKSTVKTAAKTVEATIGSGDLEAAKEKLRMAMKTIDQAAAKGVIHRNTASRKISRLTKRLNRAAASASV